jgi:hypothetical protein
MTDPEEPDALVPPPVAEQPGSIPWQSWPGATQQQPTQQQPQYGPPPGYPPQYQYGGYGYPPPRQQSGTNGMAIAAMVCGICGFLCLVPGLVGIILGAVSLPQIRRSQQNGRGMAITGIVVGSLWIVAFVLLIVLGHDSSGSVQVGNSGGSGLGS